MTHHLEEYITKIPVSNYAETLVCYGDTNLESLSEPFTGLTPPFNSQVDAETFWKAVLLADFGEVEILTFWNTRLDPNQEQGDHTHTEHAWDEDDTIHKYTAVLYSKFNSSVHKPTYFSDNQYRALEYKPANITQGDCLVFPSNIYHRAPKNTSEENRITSVCIFTRI